MAATLSREPVTAPGLRSWARGVYDQEAGVELLIRAFGGRFAQLGCPWVRPCDVPGWYWIDTEAIADYSGGLSGGERRVLAVVRSLIGSDPLEQLGDVMAGVDRVNLQLILAALAHAGGSHQQVDLVVDDEGGAAFTAIPALVVWPGLRAVAP